MAKVESNLKERVRAFWQAHACGTKFTDAEAGLAARRGWHLWIYARKAEA